MQKRKERERQSKNTSIFLYIIAVIKCKRSGVHANTINSTYTYNKRGTYINALRGNFSSRAKVCGFAKTENVVVVRIKFGDVGLVEEPFLLNY